MDKTPLEEFDELLNSGKYTSADDNYKAILHGKCATDDINYGIVLQDNIHAIKSGKYADVAVYIANPDIIADSDPIYLIDMPSHKDLVDSCVFYHPLDIDCWLKSLSHEEMCHIDPSISYNGYKGGRFYDYDPSLDSDQEALHRIAEFDGTIGIENLKGGRIIESEDS